MDTTGWDRSHAEEMLDNQHLPIQRIGLTDFRTRNIDFSGSNHRTFTDLSTAPWRLWTEEEEAAHRSAFEAANTGGMAFANRNHRGGSSIMYFSMYLEDLTQE